MTAKRVFDVFMSLLAGLVFSPIIVVVTLLVRLKLGRPVFFKQVRPGLHGRPFTLYKFRTMTDTRDQSGHLLPDAVRLTRFGRLLRATSLDELPELWNVLRGDMSVVGPRPLLVEYLTRYTPEQARRHEVKPGITGWAQINGRQNISFSQRIDYDLEYVRRQSLRFDIYILLRTIPKVLGMTGVQSGQDVREVDDLNPPSRKHV